MRPRVTGNGLVAGVTSINSMVSSMRWFHWFGTAVALFVVGVGALLVLGGGGPSGDDDMGLLDLIRRPTTATGLTHTIAYAVWLLSWLGTVAGIGIGVLRIWRPPS